MRLLLLFVHFLLMPGCSADAPVAPTQSQEFLIGDSVLQRYHIAVPKLTGDLRFIVTSSDNTGIHIDTSTQHGHYFAWPSGITSVIRTKDSGGTSVFDYRSMMGYTKDYHGSILISRSIDHSFARLSLLIDVKDEAPGSRSSTFERLFVDSIRLVKITGDSAIFRKELRTPDSLQSDNGSSSLNQSSHYEGHTGPLQLELVLTRP